MKYLGYFLFILSILTAIYIRIDGYDLTEMELLINYPWLCLLTIFSLFTGYGILILHLNNKEN